MANEAGRAPAATINEQDTVVLIHPLPAKGLDAGALGTVVAVHDAGAAFHVEFAAAADAQPLRVRLPREQLRLSTHEDA